MTKVIPAMSNGAAGRDTFPLAFEYSERADTTAGVGSVAGALQRSVWKGAEGIVMPAVQHTVEPAVQEDVEPVLKGQKE